MSADTEKTTLCCKFNNKAGYILIVYSSLISFALILFAGAYLSFQENQVRQLERGISSIKAFYIAQAGLKKISYLNNIELKEDFGAGRYEVTSVFGDGRTEYTSEGWYPRDVKSHIWVKRTLKADIIGKQDTGSDWGVYYRDKYIEGAVYVHNDFSTINLPGLIDGKDSSYALQTGDIVISDPFYRNIKFRGPIIQRTKRDEYIKIWNEFYDLLYKDDIRSIDKNDNSKIIEHTSSNIKQWLDLGGAEYYFNIGSGEIKTARLIVKKNKTYTLPSGNYFLEKLTVEQGARLRVSGPVTIFLYSRQHTNDFKLQKNGSINKDGNPGDFTLLGFNRYKRNTPLPVVEMFKSSQLYGIILAPYYQFIIHEGAKIEGSLIAHNFIMWYKEDTEPPPWEIIYADLSQSGGTGGGSSSFSDIRNWKEVESR